MRRKFLLSALALCAAPAAWPAEPAAFKTITWDSLLPKDWDPMKDLKGLDLGSLNDADPRAAAALKKLQDAWNNAPVNAQLDAARVRIPGFVVPLDAEAGQMREFLLVPYYGACIHSPPPPSNQAIHVVADKPFKGVRMMDAVWVSGTMKVERRQTSMGVSGYRMSGDLVAPYQAAR